MALGLSKRKNDFGGRGIVASIEPGAEIEGKLRISSGTVRINSHFKGEISGDGTLIVAERGEVEAGIAVKTVTVVGKVKGSIQAAERLEIRAQGVVLGDITTPVLLVEPGGYFDGQCHMPALADSAAKGAAEQDDKERLA
ncbi:MAG: bactofilin family protein [Terriglobia bacterium]